MAIQFNNTGTGTVTLASPSSGTPSFTLPSADGTSGQVLQTNGSGVLSFASAAAPTTGQVQTAMAGSAVGDNGTWALCNDQTNSTTDLAAGSTLAGSSLRYAGYGDTVGTVYFSYSGTTSGTWRLMGFLPRAANTTVGGVGSLWLRIS
jgi:hypothetical protein